jgi:hypothetical protein
MYNITDYSKDRAKELGVIIKPSTKKEKKIDVFDDKGKYLLSIGSSSHNDYPTYIIKKGIKYANERRRLYKIRHNKDRNIKGTAGYYADKILW